MPLPRDGSIVVFKGPVPRQQAIISGSLLSPRVPNNFPQTSWSYPTPSSSGLSGFFSDFFSRGRRDQFQAEGQGQGQGQAWQLNQGQPSSASTPPPAGYPPCPPCATPSSWRQRRSFQQAPANGTPCTAPDGTAGTFTGGVCQSSTTTSASTPAPAPTPAPASTAGASGMSDRTTLAWQKRFIGLPQVHPPGMGAVNPHFVGIARAVQAGAISQRGAQFAAEAVLRGRS
jgi:hypothetical protein